MGAEVAVINSRPPSAALASFLDSPPGRYALTWEQTQVNAVVTDFFGYHAMQLGLPELDALRDNRMPLRFCASDRLLDPAFRSPDSGGAKVMVINHFEELPFATASIDLVVLPHILEFASEPHQVLREVDRVLVPEGHVVITGFNPGSLWGLRQVMSRLGAQPYLPRAGQFISLPRIKDWLKLLSFEVNRGRFGCYAPSVRSEKWLSRWSFMEKAGDRWWPVLGSVYLLTAIKRVRGMRLIGPAWKKKEERVRHLVPLANRNMLLTTEATSVQVEDDAGAANDAGRVGARR